MEGRDGWNELEELLELKKKRELLEKRVEEKPYLMNLRKPVGEEMRFELESYAPLGHYDIKIQEIADKLNLDEY